MPTRRSMPWILLVCLSLTACASDPSLDKAMDEDPPKDRVEVPDDKTQAFTEPDKPKGAVCPQGYDWRCVASKPCPENHLYKCADAEPRRDTCHWMCAREEGASDMGGPIVPPLTGTLRDCPRPVLIWTQPPPPPLTGCPGCGPYQSWKEEVANFLTRQQWICHECSADADCIKRGKKYCRKAFGQRVSHCTDNFCAQHRLVRFVPPDQCVPIPGPPSMAPR